MLTEWSVNGSLSAAAQEALLLDDEPQELTNLIGQWSAGDFSALPEIVLLSNEDISGALGAYALSTGKIYLNRDWLATASQDQVISVLTEELGHHLDGLFNEVDTAGDEGEVFARLLHHRKYTRHESDSSLYADDMVLLRSDNGDTLIAEASSTPIISNGIFNTLDGWTSYVSTPYTEVSRLDLGTPEWVSNTFSVQPTWVGDGQEPIWGGDGSALRLSIRRTQGNYGIIGFRTTFEVVESGNYVVDAYTGKYMSSQPSSSFEDDGDTRLLVNNVLLDTWSTGNLNWNTYVHGNLEGSIYLEAGVHTLSLELGGNITSDEEGIYAYFDNVAIAPLVQDDGQGVASQITSSTPGIYEEGVTLFAPEVTGDPDGDSATPNYQYQWFLGDAELPGETGASLVIPNDGSGTYKVAVTYTDAEGNIATVDSAPQDVLQVDNGQGTAGVIISHPPNYGIFEEGVTLVAPPVFTDPDGDSATPNYQYKWFLDDSEIVGETGSSYAVPNDGAGTYKVALTYTDAEGNIATVETPARDILEVDNGQGTIGVITSSDPGVFEEGVTLSAPAVTGDPDGDSATPNYQYQWFLDGVEIADAINQTYLVPGNGAGTYKVQLQYTDAQGYTRVLETAEQIVSSVFDIASASRNDPNILISGLSQRLGTGNTAKIESVTTERVNVNPDKGKPIWEEQKTYTLIDSFTDVDGITFTGGDAANNISGAGDLNSTDGLSRPAFDGQLIIKGELGTDSITGGTYRNLLQGGGIVAPGGDATGLVDSLTGTTGAIDVFDLRTSNYLDDAYAAANSGSARISNFTVGEDYVLMANDGFSTTRIETTSGKGKKKVTTYTFEIRSGDELVATIASPDFTSASTASDLRLTVSPNDPTAVLFGTQQEQLFF
ncbi:hypothetical protein [Cyanobium sp. CH-040]|uniref:hypothetical protein n=1 Tax=Cyanobium sp. CH-040 TaxID=2823708 RepID=UPI0020CDB60A|nr:hypothetical protein [Cyanobium sp. CH-040]